MIRPPMFGETGLSPSEAAYLIHDYELTKSTELQKTNINATTEKEVWIKLIGDDLFSKTRVNPYIQT